MTPEQLHSVEEIFHAALDQKPDQLGSFLDKACNSDAVLRQKVEELLTANKQGGEFHPTADCRCWRKHRRR